MFNFFKKDKEPEVKTLDVYAVVDGEIKEITEVSDPVFAQKMMGDGFAIVPDNGAIYAPIDGEIVSVFPAKHAFGITTPQGLEVLVHMGIDTVSLDGVPFTTKATQGDKVVADTQLSQVDLAELEEHGKDNVMIVVFTNTDEKVESFELTKTGKVTHGEVIGQVNLK